MKSRPSHLAAAASPAAVLQTSTGANAQIMNAPEHSGSSPARPRLNEVDVADLEAEAYWRDPTVDLFVRLEEFDPGDPGQLSGISLRVIPGRELPFLDVEIGDTLQPYGGRTSHCLGYLDSCELIQFAKEVLAGKITRAWLRELYDGRGPDAFSGVTLNFNGTREADGPQIHVQFAGGAHCLGVLRGELVMRFLQCVRDRFAERIAA